MLSTIFGGTGYIGTHLIAELLPTSDIRVVSRYRHPASHQGLQYYCAEPDDINAHMEAVEGADVVYYLACGKAMFGESCIRYHLNSTIAVAQACLQRSVRRFVYISSISALNLSRRK